MIKKKVIAISMRLASFAALFGAVLIANHVCPLLSYQDKEPESVRKLRKF